MKKHLIILPLLLFFQCSFGQYATIVKRTAEAMLSAERANNYEAYVNYFYPTEIKQRGGKAKFAAAMKSREPALKAIGLTLPTESLGKVSKFYKAGKEIHCTIESLIKIKTSARNSVTTAHYLAISGDQGKSWKFIMTNGKTPSEVWAMVPKFNGDLTWVDYNEQL